MKSIRKLAIALLNDNWGINEDAWTQLRTLLESEGGNADLINSVQSDEGRFYLSANFSFICKD